MVKWFSYRYIYVYKYIYRKVLLPKPLFKDHIPRDNWSDLISYPGIWACRIHSVNFITNIIFSINTKSQNTTHALVSRNKPKLVVELEDYFIYLFIYFAL